MRRANSSSIIVALALATRGASRAPEIGILKQQLRRAGLSIAQEDHEIIMIAGECVGTARPDLDLRLPVSRT